MAEFTDTKSEQLGTEDSLRERAKKVFQYKIRRLTLPEFVVAAILIVCGVLLRTVHIVFREMFGGEFQTLDYLQGNIGSVDVMRGMMPLYYWLMNVWTMIVGMDNDLLLRLPSVVFGLLTLATFYLCAQRFMRGAVFTGALLVFCLNPILIGISNQATPYALLGFLATLSCYYTMVALNKGGERNWIGMGVTAVLGFLTHPVFLFLVFGQMLFVAFRPARRPKALWVTSIVSIGVVLAAMLSFALMGQDNLKHVEGNIPALDDVTYGLVAMICGDFNRYWNTEFVRAVLYFAVFASLFVSGQYYWRRQEEDNSLPEGVVWIDDTADIVQKWRRLTLASFLRLQWLMFGVPVFSLFIIACFVDGVAIRPEFFIVCLPAFAVLFAAGVDYAPGRYTRHVLTGLIGVIMVVYGVNTVADNGYGVERLSRKLADNSFDASKDKLLIAYYRESIAPSFARYGIDQLPAIKLTKHSDMAEVNKQVQAALDDTATTAGRVFVFYWNDYNRTASSTGVSSVSYVRQWFAQNVQAYPMNYSWTMSRPEHSALMCYLSAQAAEELRAQQLGQEAEK